MRTNQRPISFIENLLAISLCIVPASATTMTELPATQLNMWDGYNAFQHASQNASLAVTLLITGQVTQTQSGPQQLLMHLGIQQYLGASVLALTNLQNVVIQLAAQTATSPVGPVVGSPGVGTPDVGTPGVGTPDVGTPGVGTPGAGTPGIGTPGIGAPGGGTEEDEGTPNPFNPSPGPGDPHLPSFGPGDPNLPSLGGGLPPESQGPGLGNSTPPQEAAEPAALFLFGSGLLGLSLLARRRRRTA